MNLFITFSEKNLKVAPFGDVPVSVCDECSAIVWDKELHRLFHWEVRNWE